jgi:diacylglycerol kinase (ATP)
MSLELVNTALEAAVDVATDEWKPLAKKAKDAAAGAVLVSAIMAAVIGLLIFIPRLFDLIYALAG